MEWAAFFARIPEVKFPPISETMSSCVLSANPAGTTVENAQVVAEITLTLSLQRSLRRTDNVFAKNV